MINTFLLSNPLIDPPENLSPWLNYTFSLTDKLKQAAGEASLCVLDQQWQSPSWWDKFALGLTGAAIMHRNSIISAKGLACWFARTIVPEYCYLAHKSFFDRLKQESFGALLFNTAGLSRKALVFYPINTSCLEYYWVPQAHKEPKGPLWLRISSFCFEEKENFYLIEIFLPGLLRVLS